MIDFSAITSSLQDLRSQLNELPKQEVKSRLDELQISSPTWRRTRWLRSGAPASRPNRVSRA